MANWLYHPRRRIKIKLCMVGGLRCVVIHVKCDPNRSRSYGAVGGRIWPFPITLPSGLYNSLYYRTSRDQWTSKETPIKHLAPSGGKVSRKFPNFFQPFRRSPDVRKPAQTERQNSTPFSRKWGKNRKFFDLIFSSYKNFPFAKFICRRPVCEMRYWKSQAVQAIALARPYVNRHHFGWLSVHVELLLLLLLLLRWLNLCDADCTRLIRSLPLIRQQLHGWWRLTRFLGQPSSTANVTDCMSTVVRRTWIWAQLLWQ